MPGSYAGFVDAGYLIAEGARVVGRKRNYVRPSASSIVEWLSCQVPGETFLRAYWYDGAYAPSHREFENQRRYFDAIAYTPGVQLRLGHLVERQYKLEEPIRKALRTTANGLGVAPDELVAEFDKNWTFYPERQQKGVDTLITLDMVRLASRSAFGTAIVIAGDRDLAEVVRTVQDYGVRVLIATPNRASVVVQLADGVLDIDVEDVEDVDRPTDVDHCT